MEGKMGGDSVGTANNSNWISRSSALWNIIGNLKSSPCLPLVLLPRHPCSVTYLTVHSPTANQKDGKHD